MSKYVIAWPQDHRTIKWLYYAEIRDNEFDRPYRGTYASPTGMKVILRSALLSEARLFDSEDEADDILWSRLGYDPNAQIREMTEEDFEEAKKEKFNILLGNVNG